MPIYEYVCVNDHRTSQLRPISLSVEDLEKSICGKCYESAELAVSKPGRPILVGDGFHENMYAHGKLGS